MKRVRQDEMGECSIMYTSNHFGLENQVQNPKVEGWIAGK